MEIREIRPEDARGAALVHMEGQPGTFLTSLGETFLTTLYHVLADSPWGYGYVAVEGDEVLGVVVATTDTHTMFKQFLTRQGPHLFFPVLCQILKDPSLIGKIIQTLFYPGKLESQHGEAEFLFMGVSAKARRQHIASQLLDTLIEGTRRRGATALLSTVDAGNPVSNAMHVKRPFILIKTFDLYGRKMNLYSYPYPENKPEVASRKEEAQKG